MEQTIVKLRGNLVFTSRASKQQIQEVLGERFLELDLSNVNIIDSSGVDLIVKLALSVKKVNGSLKITGIKPHIRDLMDICTLSCVIKI